MKEDRLNGLALMMVHRTISVSVENIIDTFAARHAIKASKNAIGSYIRRQIALYHKLLL